MDMLACTPVQFNCLQNQAKTFIIPARRSQFIQQNNINKLSVRRCSIAMNTNSAFTGSYTENSFWYQKFDLRQTKKLRERQPIVDFDDAVNCRLNVTAMQAMTFQVKICSIQIDNFNDHYVIIFDLSSKQDATAKCHYPELDGKPLRLELHLVCLLEHIIELTLLGERMISVAVDNFW